MKRTHRALSAALAVVLASSLCTIPAYAVESDAEPAPPGRVQADETAPNQSPEADHGPGSEVPDASGTAEASGSESQTRTENTTEPTTSPLQAENASRSAVAPPAGELRVTLTEGRPAATAGTVYEVALADSDGVQVGAQQLNLSLEGDSWSVARFDGLADGSYTLSVRAPGIAPYSQKIDVKGDSSAVELYVGDLAADPQAPARIGVLVPGDVNGDGTVDDADASAIIDDIEAGAASPACDANGDGTVSLADLETAVSSFDRVAVEATVARSLPPAAVEAAPGEGSEVASGSLDEVVGADAKPVSLRASEAISDEHPVEVSFDLAKDSEQAPQLGGMVINVPPSGDHAPEAGRLLVELTDGTVREIGISRAEARAAFFRSSAPTAVIDENGTVVVDFGGQIAVKKVTLVITKTQGGTNLAEVSKVEFLNNMEERIPEPELNIPGELSAVAGSKQFSVSWKAETNVTGYELSISANGREEVKRTTGTSLSITQFDEQKIKNGTVFTLKVRSTNGAWRSDWSGSVQVTPKAEKVPDAPEGISLSGAYRGFKASWKNMEDTDSYNLFYREKADEGGDFTKVPDLTKTSCSVDGLKDDTEYQVYLTGANEIGESAPSVMAVVRTANVKPAQLPAYRLVNTENADGDYLNRIVSATYGRGSMIDSPLDEASGEAKSAYGLFDDDYASYLKVADWDEGGFYPALGKGVTVTFDQPQTLGMVSFADVQDGVPYGRVSVSYVDDAGAWQTVQANVQMRTGENGRKYVLAKLPQPVTSSKVRIGMGHSWSSGNVVVAEMRFHAYDSLENDIMALYADDLHLELKDDVTSAAVDELQQRLDTPDPASGEFNPYRVELQVELDNARKLLATQGLEGTVRVHNGISSARDNRSLGISGLNAWQPLGAVVAEGDQIVVYTGAKGAVTGKEAPLRLVVSQQHPESSNVSTTIATLKVGRNEITIPSLSSLDVEHGGQLYVEYTGDNDAADWGVRVSGAQAVPVLDLYQVDDPAERLARTTAYVKALEAYVPALEESHGKLHGAGGNAAVRFDYDPRNCILNATDVMLDQMMYSVPAQQMLAGAGSGAADERAARLLASFDAMDQMMELFYQHKGLASSFDKGTADAVKKANLLPSQHLNIRYTRMFAGAFMYAAGNHIGIEWDSVPGLGEGSPVAVDGDGEKASGSYFGWGIAHEIGHNINQAQYAYPEVTNNYFAQLSQSNGTSASARFSYDEVYDRVTSGDEGRTGSVFTQLAMYWQLRLAYDAGGAYQLYDTYQQAFDNRFFARVDSYARAPKTAPAPKGTELVLGGGEKQNIIRLASAAAERDLTDFFQRWGFTADETTKAYVSQFPAETRALSYANDDARAYARSHEDTGAVLDKGVARATAEVNGSEVALSLGADASAGDSVLGYEIARLTTADGVQQRQVVGFAQAAEDGTASYVDNASSLGNRVVSYEVTVVDKFLNRSKALVLDPIKLTGNGLQDKSGWTVSTNMSSAQDTVPPATDDDPDAPAPKPASELMVDGKADTVYTGGSDGEDPVIMLDMGKPTEVTSLRYTLGAGAKGSAIGDYRIETSLDGESYTLIKKGSLSLDEDGKASLYFDNGKDPWICTYDARYLRITAVGQAGGQLSVAELDVFGPSGDDVSFLDANGGAAGILKSDFVYQKADENLDKQFIPKGSLVFTGSYKGNPAYNVVVLYDQDGNVVGGVNADGSTVASQIIMAPQPGDAMLGDVSEGSWVYWIEPGDFANMELPKQVRAELYRVDNALTNEGQRLVSDSLPGKVPDNLPDVELGGNATVAAD